MNNIDSQMNILIGLFLRQMGADPITQRELMIVAGAQAKAELDTAASFGEAMGDGPLTGLEERVAAATKRGRDLALLAIETAHGEGYKA